MKKHKNIILILVIAICLLVLGGAVMMYMQNGQQNNEEKDNSVVDTNQNNEQENKESHENQDSNTVTNNTEAQNKNTQVNNNEQTNNSNAQTNKNTNAQTSKNNNVQAGNSNTQTNNNTNSQANNSNTQTNQNTNSQSNKNTNTQTSDNKGGQNNSKTSYQLPKDMKTGIFASYYNKALQKVNSMTLEEKVGQMFLVRYNSSTAISQIKNENPGGYVLFARDFKGKTKQSMKAELQKCQKNSKIKLLLSVDEEGGKVVRVSAYPAFRSTKFKSTQDLLAEGGVSLLLKDSTEKSSLLKSIGLNMNLAPVVDVATKKDSFIYPRSFGKNAEQTANYTSELIKRMNKDNMISSMKHFPGYGDNADTHTGVAVDNRSYSTFKNSDFLPFKSGIRANAPTILVNHNIVKCMDSSKPASLSPNVHKILRNELGFSGLVITDDLAMSAVKQYVENGNAAIQAVKAGNDMIISSDFVKQKKEIVNAVKNKKLDEDLINKAVVRILACKYRYGII